MKQEKKIIPDAMTKLKYKAKSGETDLIMSKSLRKKLYNFLILFCITCFTLKDRHFIFPI